MDFSHTLSSYDRRDRDVTYSDDEEDSEEPVDPRVKIELERLNSSTLEINRLEQDLQEVQAAFRQTLTESALVLKSEANHLGKCVEKARPYYQALDSLRKAQIETQKAALRFENASNAHKASKEMVALAEQKLSSSSEHRVLDPALQEMLNRATAGFMESEQEKYRSEQDHRQIAQKFTETEREMAQYKNKLKSAIIKSRTYFELRSKYKLVLEGHKRKVEELQYYLAKAKNTYSLALKNLEDISEEIHEMRRSRDSLDILLDKREEGVGAETPHDDISCRGASIIEENFGCGSSLSSITTSNTGQIYGLKVAVLTKDVDDWQLSLTGESSGSKDGTLTSAEDGGPRNTAECESLRVANNVAFQKDNLMDEQEQCDDNEMQKSSLKKVISSSSSKNGNIVQSFESEHTVTEELKNLRETKESKWEKATELKTLPEREETIVCGCEARCVDPSSQQEPKTVELVCSHKETTDVRANEESERETAVKDNEAENFEIDANSGAFVINEKLAKPNSETESRVRSVTCGEVDEMAPELGASDSIVEQHDVDSRATDDPDTSNKLTNPITEAGSKVGSVTCGEVDEMAPELGASDSIVRQHDVDSRVTDDPDTSNKLTNPITEAGSKVGSVTCGEVNEMAPELGVSHSIVGQHDVDSRATDDPGTSNKLTDPITEAESEQDLMCGRQDQKACEREEIIEGVVGHQDEDSRVTDGPDISNKLTNPAITEAESEPDLTCGRPDQKVCEREEIVEGVAVQQLVGSGACDNPGICDDLNKPGSVYS